MRYETSAAARLVFRRARPGTPSVTQSSSKQYGQDCCRIAVGLSGEKRTDAHFQAAEIHACGLRSRKQGLAEARTAHQKRRRKR